MRARPRVVACVVVALLPWLAPLGAHVPKPQKPARFGAEVVLVPIDVRVVDAQGNPVTDLTSSDFTILENGRKQEIAQFATRSSRDATAAGRTFAIVLGRGRLNDRGKAIDALIDFIHSQLQPRDRVAVFAYLRAPDLAVDHDAVVRLLERYRARHEEIEDRLKADEKRNVTDRLAGPNQPLSSQTRSAIEALFDATGLPATQRMPGTATPLPYNDGNYLIRAIEVLRHVEGEKHLVFVAERAPGVGQGDFVAKKAAAARVTVSILQTGGLDAAGMPSERMESAMSRITQRSFAEETGGVAAFYQAAAGPLTRLARATSFEYALGYYPVTSPRDGEYRQLKVTAKRPGVTLLYRHGYEPSPKPDGQISDIRQMFVTSRIRDAVALPASAWAAQQKFPKVWMPMTALSASVKRGESGSEDLVEVEITISLPALIYAQSGDRQSDVLDFAVFAEDARGNRIGEKWDRIEIVREASARPKELLHIVHVAITGRPAQVRLAILEYETDHVRVWTLRLPRQ